MLVLKISLQTWAHLNLRAVSEVSHIKWNSFLWLTKTMPCSQSIGNPPWKWFHIRSFPSFWLCQNNCQNNCHAHKIVQLILCYLIINEFYTLPKGLVHKQIYNKITHPGVAIFIAAAMLNPRLKPEWNALGIVTTAWPGCWTILATLIPFLLIMEGCMTMHLWRQKLSQ